MDLEKAPPSPAREWTELWETFHRAREIEASERDQFLNNIDSKISREVKELLAFDDGSGENLESLVVRELNRLSDPPLTEEPCALSGEVLSNRFRILREIGRGGMGTIYEAFDQELGSHVALKMMRPDLALDPPARERFYREISLARQITHPNACRIFDLFRHENTLFLTMELLQGETLHEKIRHEGPLDRSLAMSIVLQISQALTAIHQAGVIHRDFKSSNIILVPNENGFRVVVTDFGLAVSLPGKGSLHVTQTGEVLGTPEFMAPEQLKGDPVTPATDIYALGVVLYEMVTGQVPFSGESPLTITAKRISEDAPSPRRLVPDLERRWENTILRCLERNPKHRFPNAQQVVQSLRGTSLKSVFLLTKRTKDVLKVAAAVFAALLFGFLFWQRHQSVPPGNGSSTVLQKRLWSGATGIPAGLLATDGHMLIDVDWKTADLMSIDMASGTKRHLTNSDVWFIPGKYSAFPNLTSLSPDGRKVAYSVQHVDNRGCDLRIVGMQSNAQTLYTSDTTCANPMDWTPDGKQVLLLLDKKDGTANFALLSVTNGFLRILKTLPSSDVRKASISPDGRYLAYDYPQENGFQNRDIFLLALKDLTETRVVADGANDYLLGWPFDSKKLVFASDRSGTYDAWMINIAQGKALEAPELLRNDIGQIFPLKFTRDGSLYYSHLISSMDVYTATLNGDQTAFSSPPLKMPEGVVGSNRAPEFSPDGNFLIYQTDSDRLATRWSFRAPAILKLLSLQTKEEREIPHHLQSIGGRIRWSPDGHSILTTGDDGSWNGLFKIDVATGVQTRLVKTTHHGIIYFDWSSDGESVFYLGLGVDELIAREISTGREKKICSGVSDFAVSRDGHWLAILNYDIYRGINYLSLVPATGGEPKQILTLNMPDWISQLTWSPDSQSVFFTKGRRDRIDDPHELWKISISNGRPQKIGVTPGSVLDLRVHPDGRRMVIWSSVDNSEIWVLENFLLSDRRL